MVEIIFICDMSINFMIQAVKVLHSKDYSEDEINTIYNFIISLDKNQINSYYNAHEVLSYKNDLELYVEIIDILIKIYEEQEDYEKCTELMAKKHESLTIMNKKTKEYV